MSPEGFELGRGADGAWPNEGVTVGGPEMWVFKDGINVDVGLSGEIFD